MGLPILTYHAIDTSGSVISTDPKWFAETMRVLHSEGFQCVNLESWIEAGRPDVDRGFAMTFDDGLSSLRLAAESIAKHGFTATTFLVTGWMGRDNRWPGQMRGLPASSVLDWSELDDLRRAGFHFGAHTVNHPDLNACDEEQLERELIDSKRHMEDRLMESCRLFAYPYGRSSTRVWAAVSRHFLAGFGTRLDVSSDFEDLFALSRLDAYYFRSRRALDRLVSGKWSVWLRARRAARFVRSAWPQVIRNPGWLGSSRAAAPPPAHCRKGAVPPGASVLRTSTPATLITEQNS